MDMTTYKISNHAKTRYAERIMNKDNTNDINRFIVENEDKIKTDINKLISYGECIFIGKQSQKDGKGNVLTVYVKDNWVILVDVKSEIVVTLYKVDLGCDDDFNSQYVSKMMEKINDKKKDLENIKLENECTMNTYKEMIDEAQCQINEYKSMIKNLEELCKSYQSIIDNNIVKVSQANKEVAECVNKLVGKKEF